MLLDDLTKNRKVGPFRIPPENLIVSPMGAFYKSRDGGKYRVIHDLSWPPGRAVNDFIDKEEVSCTYIKFEDVLERVKIFGKGALMAKLDLKDAFKNIKVCRSDWALLGTQWQVVDHTGTAETVYFMDTVLPFGCRSSPKLFNQYADAVEWIAKKRGANYMEHYLDDYVTVGPPKSTECHKNIEILIRTCNDLNLEINYKKLEMPSTRITFLGVEIDTLNEKITIPSEKIDDILKELRTWQSKRSTTKREILSIAGRLGFLSRVVQHGRPFTRRLFDASAKLRHLHHRVKVDREIQEDLQWWLTFLETFSGIVYMDVHPRTKFEIWTDACDYAYAAWFPPAWIQEEFPTEFRDSHINLKEYVAVCAAFFTWASYFRRNHVLVYCDNWATVYILRKRTTRSKPIMQLVRTFTLFCANHDISYETVYIPTAENTIADALSRLDNHRFRSAAPFADVRSCKSKFTC